MSAGSVDLAALSDDVRVTVVVPFLVVGAWSAVSGLAHVVHSFGNLPFGSVHEDPPFGSVDKGRPFGWVHEDPPFGSVDKGLPFGLVHEGPPSGWAHEDPPFGSAHEDPPSG